MTPALKTLAKKVIGRAGYTVSRATAGPGGPDAYALAVLTLASCRERVRVAVVGANDGRINDPIYPLLTGPLRAHSEVLLVEPQKSLIPHLRDSYARHPRHHIANAAVGEGSPLTLYAIKAEYHERIRPAYAKNWPAWRAPTGVTSSDRRHVSDWLRGVTQADFPHDDAIEELRVETAPLPALLDAAGLPPQIDLLQIDTEGFDDAIIYNSDLEATRPRIVFFENKLLPEERKEALLAYLRDRYSLHDLGVDTLAVRRP